MILLDLLLGTIAGIAVAALVLAIVRRRDATAAPTAVSVPQPDTARSAATAHAEADLVVSPPERLPKFVDVGGLDDVKAELRDTLGLVLRDPERAHTYRVTWNGVLMHGPPGTGKSFLRACARW